MITGTLTSKGIRWLITRMVTDKVIIRLHRTLARVLMTRFCCQSLIPLPAIGNSRIHLWKRGEDFEKRNAESIRKGVVGSIGIKAPIIPKKKLIHAMMNQIIFTTFFQDP